MPNRLAESLAARGLVRDVSPQSRILDAVISGIGALVTLGFSLLLLGNLPVASFVPQTLLVTLVLWSAVAIERWSPVLALTAAWVGRCCRWRSCCHRLVSTLRSSS